MTNAEKIRQMSEWELAEFIYSVSEGETKITTCNKECRNCEFSESWCVSNIAEWLKEEA